MQRQFSGALACWDFAATAGHLRPNLNPPTQRLWHNSWGIFSGKNMQELYHTMTYEYIWIHMKYLLYIIICYIYMLHICYISVTYLLHCVWDVYDIFLTRLCCRGPMLLWMWPFSLHTNCSAVPDPWGCLWQRRGGTQRSCRSAVAEPSLRLIIM